MQQIYPKWASWWGDGAKEKLSEVNLKRNQIQKGKILIWVAPDYK